MWKIKNSAWPQVCLQQKCITAFLNSVLRRSILTTVERIFPNLSSPFPLFLSDVSAYEKCICPALYPSSAPRIKMRIIFRSLSTVRELAGKIYARYIVASAISSLSSATPFQFLWLSVLRPTSVIFIWISFFMYLLFVGLIFTLVYKFFNTFSDSILFLFPHTVSLI